MVAASGHTLGTHWLARGVQNACKRPFQGGARGGLVLLSIKVRAHSSNNGVGADSLSV